MTKKIIITSMLLAFVGGIGYGLTADSKVVSNGLPKGLKKVSEKTEKVTYYTLSVTKDGMKAEFPIVKVGDTYYGLPMKLEDGNFKRVEPKVSLVPVDGKFLSKADVEFAKAGIKNFVVWGEKNRGKSLYVVFDALCPYCISGIKKLDELKKKYSSVTFLPLAVHGKESLQGLSCIYTKAKKVGMEKALKEVFSWKEGRSWEEYVKKLNSCKVDEKVKSVVKQTTEFLKENGVYATPTFFLLTEKNGEFVYYKRVGIPDFSLVEKK